MDRLTPFSPDQVYADGWVSEAGNNQVRGHLVVAPKPQVDALLASLKGAGIDLAGVDTVDAEDRLLGVNLLPAAMQSRHLDRWTVFNLALALVMGLGIAAGLGWMLHNRIAATDALAQRVEGEAAQARQTAALQGQIDVLTAAMQAADSTGQRSVPVASILNDLAERLPGDAVIERLEWLGTTLKLTGTSSEAATLSQRLGNGPHWESAQTTGAVLRDPQTGKDRFTLMLQGVHP